MEEGEEDRISLVPDCLILDFLSRLPSTKEAIKTGYINYEREYGNYVDIIEINAPYILSLRIGYELDLWKLLLLDVSSLVEAFLDYHIEEYYKTTSKEAKEEMLKGFLVKLRHVKKLTVGSSCARTLSHLDAKGLILPSNLKILDVTSPEYGDGSSDVIGESSDSDSDESGDLEELSLHEESEVDELYDASYENGDREDEGSEVDELFDI